jgi:hypothetical protein
MRPQDVCALLKYLAIIIVHCCGFFRRQGKAIEQWLPIDVSPWILGLRLCLKAVVDKPTAIDQRLHGLFTVIGLVGLRLIGSQINMVLGKGHVSAIKGEYRSSILHRWGGCVISPYMLRGAGMSSKGTTRVLRTGPESELPPGVRFRYRSETAKHAPSYGRKSMPLHHSGRRRAGGSETGWRVDLHRRPCQLETYRVHRRGLESMAGDPLLLDEEHGLNHARR